MTNAYMDAYASFFIDSAGLVSINGRNFCPMWHDSAILLQLVYDCFATGAGAHFQAWQHLTGSNATCFYSR
jgi:hypothetical protein